MTPMQYLIAGVALLGCALAYGLSIGAQRPRGRW
jgi:hypothetical protein